MTYKYKNRICPVCKKLINPYFYTFNKDDEKIHIECEPKTDRLNTYFRFLEKNKTNEYHKGRGR